MIGESRQLLTRVALIAGLAFGAWHFSVRPLHARASLLHDEVESARAEIEAGDEMIRIGGSDPAVVLATLKAHAEAYSEWWDGPAPNARFYDIIREIARDAGVSLVSVVPGRTQTRAVSEASTTRLRMESSVIDARGGYRPVLDFITAVQRRLGAVRLESVRLGTGAAQDELAIEINLTRFVFESPFPSIASEEAAP